MFTTVNGIRLFLDVDGAGLVPDGPAMRREPSVVMVHGGPGADHGVFEPVFAQLGDIAQIVHHDHRGDGRSDPSDASHWTLAQWGDDLRGLCDALGIERPIVIGTSFGGFVALSHATRHPGHATGLVLTSIAAEVGFPAAHAAFERLGGPEARAVAGAYWEDPTPEGRLAYRERCVPLHTRTRSASSDWLSRTVWRNETALWFDGPRNEHGRMDFRRALPKIECPALVMAGEEDPVMPPASGEAIVAGLREDRVTFRRFGNCGLGVVGDRPDEALEGIRTFISTDAAEA